MLLNPGFEMEWSGHRCFVFDDDNSFEEVDIGNIFVPAHWVVWFKHNDVFAQPEGTDAWKYQDERRVHSGYKAYHLFTFGKLHDAGLLQQVEVEPESKLSFTIYAHAWSNHKDKANPDAFPHPDDPLWSEGSLVGYNEIALTEVPPLNGDPQNDANGNIVFNVGIDPTGGVNPYADTVVWGDGLYSYNKHHLLSVDGVTAQSETITVFTRSVTLWPFKHNDVYYDDAELIATALPVEVECPGQPRIDYERTYILMPPDATMTDVTDIVEETWDRHKFTIGGSADDAGIGNLSSKRVIAIQPQLWNGNLEQFFGEYYSNPPVEYWPLPYENEYQLVGRLLAYSLKIGGFKLERPTTHDEMHVTSEYGVNRGAYFHNGLDLRSSFASWGDEVISATAGEVVRAGLYGDAPGYGYQVRVKTIAPDGRELWIRYAHLVEDSVAVNIGDTVGVGDLIGLPGSTGDSTADHLHIDVYSMEDEFYADPELLLESWSDETEPPTPEPDDKVRIGLHLQGGADGIWQYYDNTQSTVLKAFWLQAVDDLPAHSPETMFVFRHWVANQEPYLYADDKLKAANDFIDLFRDSLVDVAERSSIPIYVSGLNEEVPSFNPTKLDHLVRFESAFCDAVRQTHPNCYPATFTAAVGNPHESEFELLLPLARKCQETNGVMSYHAYWWANPNESGLISWWPYHAGRWQEMDSVFVANGVQVKWFFGECGAVGSSDGHNLLPGSGWKAESCYNGNWQRYEDDIVEFQRRVREWNATHGNRAIGGTLFTTNGPGWDSFDIGTSEMAKLAQVL